MPFDKDTAPTHGSKGGGNSWKTRKPKEVRDKQLKIVITPTEYDAITEKAAATGLSNAELVVRAVKAYKSK